MAQLKSTNISGNLAVTGNIVASNIDLTNLKVENIQHPEEGGMVSLGSVSLGGNASSSGKSLLQKDMITGKIEVGPTFGTSTTQFLRNDGTWAEPPSASGDSSGNVVVAKDLIVNGIGRFGNDIEVAGTVKTNAIETTDYIALKSGYPIRFFSENNSKSVDLWCNDNGVLTSSGGGALATVGDISSSVTNALKYINTHPENGGSIIPFIHNDLAFLSKKGGSYSVYSTTSTDFTQRLLLYGSLGLSSTDNMFDGSPSYAMITTTGAITVVIDMTLHKMFTYSNQFYIDFGAVGWRAKGIAVYVMNKDTETTYTLKGSTTTNAKGNWYCGVSHSSKNSSGTTVEGFNKLRVVLTNFNNTSSTSGKRIAQVGLLNYGSAGVTETFVSRGGSTMYGDLNTKNLYPTATNASNLGSSSKQYNTIYGKTIYENGTALSSKYAGTSAATQSAAGLMSAADKVKLDNIKTLASVTEDSSGNVTVAKNLTVTGDTTIGGDTTVSGELIAELGMSAKDDVTIRDGRSLGFVSESNARSAYLWCDDTGYLVMSDSNRQESVVATIADVTERLKDYLPLSGGTMTGAITLPENTLSALYSVRSGWQASQWHTSTGDEAMIFQQQNPRQSWIFRYGTDTTPFTEITPSMQIKNGGVAINKMFATGNTAPITYNLDVNGTANATTIYENGTALSEKYAPKSTVGADQIKGIYATAGNRSIWAVDADLGITFQENGSLFKDAAASSKITDTLFVYRLPIVAGNNVTFETDTANQVVKINSTVNASNLVNKQMYIIGAELQNANIQTTYSNSGCYIGTDNCLYSGGEVVATQAALLASLSAIEAKLDQLIGGEA